MAVSTSPRLATADVDLLDAPWLPVVTGEGERRALGLLDCLALAHVLREIDDPSPLVTFGIYRFLAAVLQTYAPIPDLDAWAGLWRPGRFSADLLEQVRIGCAGRLRLFDATHPFYQSGDIPLGGKPAEPVKTIGYLLPEVSTGTNVTHFSHPGDDAHALCPACCARALASLPPFAVPMGRGWICGVNGVPPIYVLARGATIFQTLLLNHLAPRYWPSQGSGGAGLPLWEEGGVVAANDERHSVSFVESLTLPPRRIRLYPTTGDVCSVCGAPTPVVVREMAVCTGRQRSKDLPLWDDPWAAYEERTTESQSKALPIRPREDREVWRDFTGLFLARGDPIVVRKTSRRRLRPGVLRQIDQLLDDGLLEATEPVRFETFGIRTDMKAKVYEWRQDSFAFPPAILGGRADEAIDGALQLAERVGEVLGQALERLHPAAERASPDWKRVGAATRDLVAFWRRAYWRRLEPHFRSGLLDPRLLGGRADQDAWRVAWQRRVREAGRTTLEQALDAVDVDADDLRRQQRARAHFYGELARLAPAVAATAAADTQ